jgi:hypothetical protein
LADLVSDVPVSPSEKLAMGMGLVASLVTLVTGLWHAGRRRSGAPSTRGPWLEIGCVALNAAVLVLAYRETFGAWALVTESGLAKIDLTVSYLLERLSALAVATGVLMSIAAVAAAVSWWARARPKAGPLLLAVSVFVLGGVLPLSATLHGYVESAMESECAGPCRRERVLAMEQARPRFRFAAGIASASFAVSAFLLGRSRRERAPAPSWSFIAATALPCCAAAAALFWHARPLAAENARPISMDHAFSNATLALVAPPLTEGVGPDELAEGPLVRIGSDATTVDGMRVGDGSELEGMLRHKRELWQSLHPGESPDRSVLVDVAPDRPAALLARDLDRIHAAGNPSIRFLLTHVVRDDRPVLGHLVGQSRSAVVTTLASSEADCGTQPVTIERVALDSGSTGALLERLVAFRREDKRVCIVTRVEPKRE